MRVHKNDDGGDGEGKRIASEAGRRYIMISTNTSKAHNGAAGKGSGGTGIGARTAAAATIGGTGASSSQGVCIILRA